MSSSRQLLRALALLGSLALVSCGDVSSAQRRAPADTTAGEIEFELAGPGGVALLVPVHINGQGPFDLVLDTGATFTCIDESLAKQLALPDQKGQIGYGAGVGNAGHVRLVRVDTLRVGDASANAITACVLDLAQLKAVSPRVQGLIGLNFLRAFRVSLDFQRRVLVLQRY